MLSSDVYVSVSTLHARDYIDRALSEIENNLFKLAAISEDWEKVAFARLFRSQCKLPPPPVERVPCVFQ